MTKQINKHWQSLFLAAIAIVLTFGAFSGAAVAQEEKSISARYGSRDPRTCVDTKAPARGAITVALALKYLNCQMEYVSGGGDLYLVENLKSVEVGGGIPYAAIMGQRSFSEIDVKHPVYPIRGSFLLYQCRNQLTEYVGPPNTNCITYNNPKATGYCYKTTFGDWRCTMSDRASNNDANIRHKVAPPKGENNGAGDTPNDKSADTNPTQPVNPKDTKQNAGKKDEPDAADSDEDGFVKPDFSEMEKYFEIVKYDYNPVDGRFNLVVKAKKETNIFRWYLTAYDADGVKVSELAFNGNVVTPAIGEPTRIYSFAPNEKAIKQVTRIAISRKLD